MSSKGPTGKSPSKPSGKVNKPPGRSGNERLKIVVRRLPYNIPEEAFWQSVAPWVNDDTFTWKVFCPGKARKGPNTEAIPSRAYILFKATEQIARFSAEYDGHIYRDKQGHESQAIVEFAPYQKVASEKKKPDGRMNTIQGDDDFISFVEMLSNPNAAKEAAESITPAIPQSEDTPLLEALRAEKTAAKDAASITRYHGHYATERYQAQIKAKGSEKGKGPQEDETKLFSRNAVVAGTFDVAVKVEEPEPTKSSRSKKRAEKRDERAPTKPAAGATTSAPELLSASPSRRSKAKKGTNTPAVVPSTPIILAPPSSNATSTSSSGTRSTPQAPASSSATPQPETKEKEKEKERRRPLLNPRMFEAAVAGAIGENKDSRRRREKKDTDGTSAAKTNGTKDQSEAEPASSLTQPPPKILGRPRPAQPAEAAAPSTLNSVIPAPLNVPTGPRATSRGGGPPKSGANGPPNSGRGKGKGGRGRGKPTSGESRRGEGSSSQGVS